MKYKYEPGAFWFGVSYESDMSFASRILNPNLRERFIQAVKIAWGRINR